MRVSPLLRAAAANKKAFPGTTLASLKEHTPLIPLFIIMAAGMTLTVSYSLRLLFKAHDISWRKEAEPWNGLVGKQYKMLNPYNFDYSKAEVPGPNYKD